VLKNNILLVQFPKSGRYLAHSFCLAVMPDRTEDIEKVLGPILSSLGLLLWELEFKKDGPRWLLRVYIDREEGAVTLDDCEAVSRDLGAVLDVEELISREYTLEVSSPGLDRTLTRPEHFAKCVGCIVKVKLFQPINDQKVLVGTLKAFDGDRLSLELDTGAVVSFLREAVAKASLEVVL
jgi:ribosome maturation factor RimP